MLDLFRRVFALHHSLHEHTRRVDALGVEVVVTQLFDLSERNATAHRGERVEVARGEAVTQIALEVARERAHERNIGHDAAFENGPLAVEHGLFFALGNRRADPCRGEERGNASAARSHALGERALRHKLDFERAVKVLLGEQLVLADVRREHLRDLLVLEQQPEAFAVDAHVVRHNRQVLRAAVA